MSELLDPKNSEEATVQVKCGTESGSGFLITSDKLLTARHVIEDCISEGEPIIIGGTRYEQGSILAESEDLDLCILNIEGDECLPLRLLATTIAYSQPVKTFGYPYAGDVAGQRFEGRVNSLFTNQIWDFSFSLLEGSDFDFAGMSGAPVIFNEMVVGFCQSQQDVNIRVVGIKKARAFLEEHGINVQVEKKPDDVPSELEKDVQSATPNYKAQENLNRALKNSKGWFLCHGSPGSGKTTFVAGYTPSEESIRICGRYFIKIPQDREAISTRTSRRSLVKWLEAVYMEFVGSLEHLESTQERINRIPSLLNSLSQITEDHQVLMIDGLDEVDDLQGFLGILPSELPEKVSIVLSCTSMDILPSRLSVNIGEAHTLKVDPLGLAQCEEYLRKHLTDESDVTTEQIQEVAAKSEGHPLYLQYLINFLKSRSLARDGLEKWISKLPSIQGEISKYYEVLWSDFFQEETKLWIVLLLSQARRALQQEDLIVILPDKYKLGFYSHFKPIRYLLKDEEKLELYHTSFGAFVSNKAAHIVPFANDRFSEFCNNNPDHGYSTENHLFHLIEGTTPTQALHICNQDWLDKSTLHDVNPDLIISDIKSVVNLALEEEECEETIRLLLLLQRAEFRYDNVFAEYSAILADALISQGKYSGALRYLVRDNAILVSDDEAIHFLRMFYENDAYDEGDALYEALQRKFRLFIKDEFPSDKKVSLYPFFVQICALSVAFHSKGKDNLVACGNLISNLKRFQDSALDDGRSDIHEAFYHVRMLGASWHQAYMIKELSFYENAQKLSQRFKITLDQQWARMIAQVLNNLNKLNVTANDNPKYREVVQDLEWLISEHGYKKDLESCESVIKALISDSEKPDLVNGVIGDYVALVDQNKPFQPRDSNGVDADLQRLHSYYFYFQCIGYRDSQKALPELPDEHLLYRDWEQFYGEAIKLIALCEGVLQRQSVEEKNLQDVEEHLHAILDLLICSLKQRASWERSYHLPEALLPFIMVKALRLYSAYFPEQLKSIIESLVQPRYPQLGVYTEGYRRILRGAIETLIENPHAVSQSQLLIEALEKHVLEYVENRWERTPELLQVVKYYSRAGEEKKASATFKEMLKTSMGPSWYKEAQLQLMNSTLELSKGGKVYQSYISKFAGLLDEASGEMTFQRYIRHSKEDLIRNMVSLKLCSLPIEYLKFEAMPPPEVLIKNAESNELDTLETGYGYAPGARNIDLEAGVLNLLGLKGVAPEIKLALCSIFTINNETFRYVHRFSGEWSTAINDISQADLPIAFNKLFTVIKNEEFESERLQFISHLLGGFNENRRAQFLELLQNEDSELADNFTDNQTELSESTREKDKAKSGFSNYLELVKSNGKSLSKEELVTHGLEAFKNERVSFWLSNWSTESDKTKEHLKGIFEHDKEVLRGLKPVLSQIDVDTWSVVDKLLWFLQEKLSEEQIGDIHKLVANHFNFLIQPSGKWEEKYHWILESSVESDPDEALVDFMIWLLNYPLTWIRSEAFDALEYLGSVLPKKTIKCLVHDIKDQKNKGLTNEASAKVLKVISDNNPSGMISYFEDQPHLVEGLDKTGHLMINSELRKVGDNLSYLGYSSLKNSLANVLPSSPINETEVVLEEDELQPIERELEELNELKVLDRAFCIGILQDVSYYCKPLYWQEYVKSDFYLRRSYGEESEYKGRYPELLRYMLNMRIFRKANGNNLEAIREILDRK